MTTHAAHQAPYVALALDAMLDLMAAVREDSRVTAAWIHGEIEGTQEEVLGPVHAAAAAAQDAMHDAINRVHEAAVESVTVPVRV